MVRLHKHKICGQYITARVKAQKTPEANVPGFSLEPNPLRRALPSKGTGLLAGPLRRVTVCHFRRMS